MIFTKLVRFESKISLKINMNSSEAIFVKKFQFNDLSTVFNTQQGAIIEC